ncbi:C40 family peptidase [Desulfobotulus sp.]|jgi:hypothetical protein|uniref:C40 family peptidase n=1 Tax=Desulfobotulus sp. TaxID=1940337 RepID=UPI002A371CC2|nr:NlpC/P60 family protein [Desulfobotulus sp.]MDY0163828.1 NlpC/P60 family protein [Desulfobotulus sp.]
MLRAWFFARLSGLRRVGIFPAFAFVALGCATPAPPLPPLAPPPDPPLVATPPSKAKVCAETAAFPFPSQPAETESRALFPYAVQAGVFSSGERAEAFADYLIRKGVDAYVLLDEDQYYKVRFGIFDSRKSAREYAETLRNQDVLESFFIVTASSEPPSPDLRRQLQVRLVETAQAFIKTPYRWGGTSSKTGFDCSGLTMTVYQLHGMELPRSSADQFLAGDPVGLDSLEKGDLVFFSIRNPRRIDHVGIYSGDGKFIHAPGRNKHIREAALSETYFRSRFKGARRYF